MQERLAGLAESCEHSVIFSLAYLRVTEDVREAVREGDYIDPVWLGQIDAVFAEDYFETVANWEAGRKDLVPRRSEERRGGKEGGSTGRYRWSPDNSKKRTK